MFRLRADRFRQNIHHEPITRASCQGIVLTCEKEIYYHSQLLLNLWWAVSGFAQWKASPQYPWRQAKQHTNSRVNRKINIRCKGSATNHGKSEFRSNYSRHCRQRYIFSFSLYLPNFHQKGKLRGWEIGFSRFSWKLESSRHSKQQSPKKNGRSWN